MERISALDCEAEALPVRTRAIRITAVDMVYQIHLTTVQKILAEHEGFLRQFLVDDKVRTHRLCTDADHDSTSDIRIGS